MSLPWMPFGFKPYGPEHDGGVTYDAATTAWVNAVVADGGSVSPTQQGYVNTLITGLKTDGLFTVLQRLWLYGGESDSHQAKIDIINLATHTLSGSPTLAAGGYTGGASKYIDTGYNPSTTASLNTHSFGSYVRGSNTGTLTEMGLTISGNTSRFISAFAGTLFIVSINTNAQDTPANTNAQGFFTCSRTASNVNGFYRNGASIGTSATASATRPNGNMYVLAENIDGTASNFSTNQSAAAFIGGALNSTQASNLYTRINTYMTSWGINVNV